MQIFDAIEDTMWHPRLRSTRNPVDAREVHVSLVKRGQGGERDA